MVENLPSTSSRRARVSTSAGLLLYSKLGRITVSDHDRDTIVGDLLSTSSGRARVSTVAKLSFYSKLGGISALELGQDRTVCGDPKAHQETKGN